MDTSAPPPPTAPARPIPPPMFNPQKEGKPKAKPMQTTFLGAALAANPTNTGQKTLLGA